MAERWSELRRQLNELHVLLQSKPESEKCGYFLSPRSILNAYREADISFDKAAMELERWKAETEGGA